MTPLFALRALLFAGELLAGSTLIMACAWLFASQKNASARHLAWAGAFGTALLLPLLAAIIPSPLRILLPAPLQDFPLQTLSGAASAATLSAPTGIGIGASAIASVFAILWLIGICFVALRSATGVWCLAQLRRRSRPFALAPEDLPRVTATRRECELRLSDCENGPISWGIFRPVILLPRAALCWPRERLHAVLLHELAHIRRRDSVVQAMSLFVCALYWPNPLVWIGAAALRREAEIAADDSVIVAGVKPSTYAGELLRLAQEFRTRGPEFSALSFFMAAPSALEARVESLLEPTCLRTGVTAMDIIRMAGLGIISAGAIAFALPSLAQATPSAPVETAPLAPVAPLALPAADAPPAPDAPAVPPATVAPEVTATHVHVQGLRRAEREQFHVAIARAQHEAREAVARATPEIERALAEARTGEAAMRAVRAAQPAIDADVARATREAHEAMARVKPEMERAIVEAKISEHVADAVREAEPAIDAAMDQAITKYDSRKVRVEVDRALRQARNEIARAHIGAGIEERVNQALDRAEQKLDAASIRVKVMDGDDDAHGDRSDDTDNDQ